MTANYCLQNFDGDFVRAMVLDPLQFDPKGATGQFYGPSQAWKDKSALN